MISLRVAKFFALILPLVLSANSSSETEIKTASEAEISRPVEIDAAVELKLILESVAGFYPLLRSSKADVDVSRGGVRASLGAFDLRLRGRFEQDFTGYYENSRLDTVLEKPLTALGSRVFAGYKRGEGDFAVYDGKAETNNSGEWRLGIDFSLLRDSTVDRRRTDLNRAEAAQKIAELGYIESLISNQAKAAQAFYDWVAAGRKLKIFRSLLDTAEKRDEILKKQVIRGEVARFDQKDNERLVYARRSLLIAQERKLIETAYKLSLFYRDEKGMPRVLKEQDIPGHGLEDVNPLSPALDSVIDESHPWYLARPDLERLRLRIAQNDFEADLQSNQLLPRFDIQLSTSKDIGQGSVTRRPQESIGAVVFEIPIQNRLAGGRLEAAKAQSISLQAQFDFAKDRARATIKDAIYAIDKFRQRYEVAKSEQILAVDLERGEQKRFQQGASNLVFVNIREQQAAEAAAKLVDAHLDYHLILADLLQATSLNAFGDNKDKLF